MPKRGIGSALADPVILISVIVIAAAIPFGCVFLGYLEEVNHPLTPPDDPERDERLRCERLVLEEIGKLVRGGREDSPETARLWERMDRGECPE